MSAGLKSRSAALFWSAGLSVVYQNSASSTCPGGMSLEEDPTLKVRPAQLSFLAIYNPSLGSSDEAVRDQIVFYSSRAARIRRPRKEHGTDKSSLEDEEENERLRQVGLAQGMVDFAKNFSNGKPVDSIDTERSRIILHELEPEWWILASIDLTRLPTTRSHEQRDTSQDEPFEYSSREVAPPQLLLRYLLRAHSIFLLHHAVSLGDLHARLSRDTFCDLLDRFWSHYVRNWDVLLHGNPATDIYNGVKLTAGGELGIGVGEEEWGSGEREVLEDFVSRTEGLVDLVVSRFGDAPLDQPNRHTRGKPSKSRTRQDPWLGTYADPCSSDGVLFSGVGAISRRPLATVSQWMEWIYKYGEGAYGVGENPSSRHRRPRRRPATNDRKTRKQSELDVQQTASETSNPSGRQPPILRRKVVEHNADAPHIPPSLVNMSETSLAKVTLKVTSPTDAEKPQEESTLTEEASLFGKEKMMKYLSLGYGSSWTLSPRGLPRSESFERSPDRADGKISNEPDNPISNEQESNDVEVEGNNLQEIEPHPEISDCEETPYIQRLEQSIGKFIIGLSGDLENIEMNHEEREGPDDAATVKAPQRVFLRTLTLEMADTPSPLTSPSQDEKISDGKPTSLEAADNKSSLNHSGSFAHGYQKLQVAVYVHQPFIFAFLFELHTGMLTFPEFYRNIHHQLGPLQRPLLRSTDPTRVAQRIADAVGERSLTTASPDGDADSDALLNAHTIYDIVFDPDKLTVRTSIPNIPQPGSLAAEGLSSVPRGPVTVSGSWYTLGIPVSNSVPITESLDQTGLVKSPWTRIEALSVHTQILNTWIANHDLFDMERRVERERTIKTGRGWWVLWMRLPSASSYGTEGDKEAFLVRKAPDQVASAKRRETGSSASGSRWLLREQTRGASSGGTSGSRPGSGTIAGVSEGVGVDARKWIDGLLSLSR